MPSVQDMPLDELRVRARDVRALLEGARVDVESGMFAALATGATLEASIAKLTETLARVQQLLPGVGRLSPESLRRLDAEEEALGASGSAPPPTLTSPTSPTRHERLTASEVQRAQVILAELKEGMERMDLLQGVAEGIEDSVSMIEAGRAELGRRAAVDGG